VPAGLPLRLGLANADNGNQAGAERRLRLGAHQVIGFAVIAAPLGMADDDVAAADVGQHGRADIAGVRALLGRVAVLRAQAHRAAGERLGHRQQQLERRADQEVARRGLVRQAGDEVAGQAASRAQQAVHLPVARDQFSPHRILIPLSPALIAGPYRRARRPRPPRGPGWCPGWSPGPAGS
jgi:hypothetical protein